MNSPQPRRPWPGPRSAAEILREDPLAPTNGYGWPVVFDGVGYVSAWPALGTQCPSCCEVVGIDAKKKKKKACVKCGRPFNA